MEWVNTEDENFTVLSTLQLFRHFFFRARARVRARSSTGYTIYQKKP